MFVPVVSYRERFYRLYDMMTDEELTVEEYRGERIEPLDFHSQEWFDKWRQSLPVRMILKVLDELVPQLEKMEANDADAIMACISKTTVEGKKGEE